MDTIVRNVTDLSADQRQVFEGVLGQPLRDDQRVVVQLMGTEASQPIVAQHPPHDQKITIKRKGDVGILPDWCAIFADLSVEEMADLEAAILDRSEGRSIEVP